MHVDAFPSDRCGSFRHLISASRAGFVGDHGANQDGYILFHYYRNWKEGEGQCVESLPARFELGGDRVATLYGESGTLSP